MRKFRVIVPVGEDRTLINGIYTATQAIERVIELIEDGAGNNLEIEEVLK